MNRNEFDSAPLDARLHAHTHALARWWETYLVHMVAATFGQSYSPARQAEITLEALAVGASRWVSNPTGRPPPV